MPEGTGHKDATPRDDSSCTQEAEAALSPDTGRVPSGPASPAVLRNGETSAASGESSPNLFVVTVNYHGRKHLERLIRSLEPVRSLNRMVVVNHSPEESLDSLTASFPLVIVEQPNRGYGAGLNRGLRELHDSDGIALLCNTDLVIKTPDQIPAACDYLKSNPEIGFLIPAMVDHKGRSVQPWRRFYTVGSLMKSRVGSRTVFADSFAHHRYMNVDLNEPREIDWGSGAAMMCRLECFRNCLPFDERFFLYFEDVDACAQIWKRGYKVVSFPQLTLEHRARLASHKSLAFAGMHIGSMIKFILKHRGLPTREQLVPRS